MKRENKNLIFENVVCWSCDGRREVTRGISCPLMHKPVVKYPDHKCPHCKSKNRHSHQLIGSKIIKCEVCDATGINMEDKFSNLTPEIFDGFPFEVWTKNEDVKLELIENYNSAGGATDYGRMLGFYNTNGADAVIQKVQEEYKTGFGTRQALNFIKKGTENQLCDKIAILIKDMGYDVYSIFLK